MSNYFAPATGFDAAAEDVQNSREDHGIYLEDKNFHEMNIADRKAYAAAHGMTYETVVAASLATMDALYPVPYTRG